MSQAQYTPAALAELLKNVSLDDDHDEKVLKYANNILKKTKTDSGALRAKVVALIKLDRYDDAIRLLEGDDGKLVNDIELEHAYALYKVGRLDDAISTARKSVSNERRKRGLKHMEAQAFYRQEKFEEATKIYGGDLKSITPFVENEDYDITVNILASKAQTAFAGRQVPDSGTNREDLEAYETAFNAACVALGKGDYQRGLILLRRARDLCSAMEGLSEEEMKAELAPVVAQEVYTLLMLGKSLDAAKLCRSENIQGLSDISIKQVATSNQILTFTPQNPYLGQRLLESVPKPKSSTGAPFNYQSKILHRNKTTLALAAGKTTAAKSLSKEHLKMFPNDYSMSTIQAAATIGVEDLSLQRKSRIKALESLFNEYPEDIGLCFALVQAYMVENDVTGAFHASDALAKSLKDQPEKRYLPAVTGMFEGLYKLQGRKQAIKDELDQASAFWAEQPGSNPEILLAAGAAMLASTRQEDQEHAGSIFSKLISDEPSLIAVAGYIASNPKDCTDEQRSQLTSIDKLVATTDIDSLIESGVHDVETKKRPADRQMQSRLLRPTKKRKTKLPKNYDPNKKVDPERWLPLRDRSSYRPKNKKDKKKAREATQGGIAPAETQEMIGGNSVKKVPQTSSGGGSGGGGGGGGGKKKKGKGKGKW